MDRHLRVVVLLVFALGSSVVLRSGPAAAAGETENVRASLRRIRRRYHRFPRRWERRAGAVRRLRTQQEWLLRRMRFDRRSSRSPVDLTRRTPWRPLGRTSLVDEQSVRERRHRRQSSGQHRLERRLLHRTTVGRRSARRPGNGRPQATGQQPTLLRRLTTEADLVSKSRKPRLSDYRDPRRRR